MVRPCDWKTHSGAHSPLLCDITGASACSSENQLLITVLCSGQHMLFFKDHDDLIIT